MNSPLPFLQGFFDKLRLMNLLIDDIRAYHEFDLRNSSVSSFSRGGHLLAAVANKDIQVFSTIHFNKMVSIIILNCI